MSELEDRINSILSDPEQMEKISRLAGSLMGDSGGDGAGGMPDMGILGKLSGLTQPGAAGQAREVALLEAMRPYMSEKRQRKIDRALQIARITRIAEAAMGEMEAPDGDKPISG